MIPNFMILLDLLYLDLRKGLKIMLCSDWQTNHALLWLVDKWFDSDQILRVSKIFEKLKKFMAILLRFKNDGQILSA